MKFAMIGGKYCKVTPQGNAIAQVRSCSNLSSNGVTKYTTILWADGTASCDCPGWTRRTPELPGVGNIRECKHSKDMSPSKHWIEKPWERPIEKVRRENEIRDRRENEIRDRYKALGNRRPEIPRRPLLIPMSPIEELRNQVKPQPMPQPAPAPTKPMTPDTRAKIQFDEEV